MAITAGTPTRNLLGVANASISCNTPVVSAGQVMYATIVHNGPMQGSVSSSIYTPPAGWIPLGQDSSGMASLWVKIATASEPSSYTWTYTGTGSLPIAALIVPLSGVDTGNPDAVAVTSNVINTNITTQASQACQGLGATQDLVFGFMLGSGGTFSASGGSSRQDINTTSIYVGLSAKAANTAGSSVTLSSGVANMSYVTLSLTPSGNGACFLASFGSSEWSSTTGTNLGEQYSKPGILVMAAVVTNTNTGVTVKWNGTSTAPNFTQRGGFQQLGNSSFYLSIWYFRIPANLNTFVGVVQGNIQVTTTGNTTGIIRSVYYSGAGNFIAGTSPIDSSNSVSYTAAASYPVPVDTAVAPNGLVTFTFNNSTLGNSETWTSDARIARREQNFFTDFTWLLGDVLPYTTPGATPAYTMSVSSSANAASAIVALAVAQAPPFAPSLTSPPNASFQDLQSGFTFTWTYNPAVGGNTQTQYCLRRKISGAPSYEYWNAGTSAFQSTQVFNASSSSSLTFAPSLWTDGNVYNWSVANVDQGGTGPFATDNTVTASAPPSVTITAPSGTSSTATPLVNWTDTLQSGAVQTAYRIVVESGTFGTTPGSGITAWDSGVVSSSATSAAVGTTLSNGTTYRFFVQVTATGPQTSAWAHSDATISYDAPAQPVLTATWDAANARTTLAYQGRDNLLTLDESSFESTLGTWGNTVNAAVARTTSQARDGIASMSMTSVSAGDMSAQTVPGTSAYPVLANKTYTALASFRSAVSARACMVIIQWYTAAGALISSSQSATVTDGTGGWVQAVITAAAPATAAFAAAKAYVVATGAANEVHYVDEVSIAPGSSTTWSVGGFTGAESVVIESSLDQANWTGVRSSPTVFDSPADQQVTLFDYEQAGAQTVYYRARATFGTGASFVTSVPSVTQSVATTITSWWLKDPLTPADNMTIPIAADAPPQRILPEIAGIFAVLGGKYPVVITDGADKAEILDFDLLFTDNPSWLNFQKNRKKGATLLVQSDMGEQWYIHFDGQPDRTSGKLAATIVPTANRVNVPVRRINIRAHEVARP